MSAPAFDFHALLPKPDGRDAALLADVRRFQALRDEVDTARQRGRTAHERAIRRTARESLDLVDRIANTTALSAAGRQAKAVAALRYHNANPDAPSGGFPGMGAMAASALFDIMQAGGEL